ncbi:MAG: glutamate--cysteine ligase [Acidithiobacillales bacterium SG8_45]|nr:MAG: glutamate--cysteine ligase [Acidithiobacillales bacterium SG8_45]
MGQEIAQEHFNKHDFAEFEQRLREETALLRDWFDTGRFAESGQTGGYEVEAWLIDDQCFPAPINKAFLAQANSPLVVPELSTFNIEINSTPRLLHGPALSRMEAELEQTWAFCRDSARTLDAGVLMIGILPTVREQDLTLDHISHMTRYRVLNEQLMRLRRGYPFELDIAGRESLTMTHPDVMLEAAATSFQIHLKVSLAQSVRYMNAAMIVSAPMVALCANSPYLFGHDLWDETRIPLFEQAVSARSPKSRWSDRVTFGHGYIQRSLFECFEENIVRHPVLLPERMEGSPDRLSHLVLHNGTIWRWNRPLIGFDANGEPHLRIEHRVVPSGPSVVDTIANAAFFFGLVHNLANQDKAPESLLQFGQARANLYLAAKQGLNAQLEWMGQHQVPVQRLLREVLLPMARQGLEQQEFDAADIDHYLDVIAQRLDSWCNGAAWQRAWVEKHGADMQALTAAYAEQQETGLPVHQWQI